MAELTKSERIAALEQKVIDLQAELAILRALVSAYRAQPCIPPQPAPWTWPGTGTGTGPTITYCLGNI